MSHATHSNAALTPRARLRLARLIVDHGWSPARAAERYDVSWRTAAKWAARYREEGPAGMNDRSSRPHRQPNRTPAPMVRKIVHLRWKQRLGPVEIGDRLSMPSSTVHAVLVRCRLNRLTHVDRATGEPIRRYEHERAGDLIHVDVKKLLPLQPVARDLRRLGHHPETDQALPAPDQRKDRALPPHPGGRLGLQEVLQLRIRTPRRSASMDPRVQPPPAPLGHREVLTHHQVGQPGWSSQLVPVSVSVCRFVDKSISG